MTVWREVLQYIQNYFQSQEALEFFINLLVAIILLSIIMFVLKMATKFVLYLLQNLTFSIEVVDEFVPVSKRHKMAITVEDVKKYVEEVKQKNKKDLLGIKKIVLRERNAYISPTAMAAYNADDSIISVYPLIYNEVKDIFLIPLSNYSYIQVDAKTAKEFQLFCIGHEIGHHVAFRKTGILHGEEIERFCDKYSEDLGIVRNPEKDFRPEDLIVLNNFPF